MALCYVDVSFHKRLVGYFIQIYTLNKYLGGGTGYSHFPKNFLAMLSVRCEKLWCFERCTIKSVVAIRLEWCIFCTYRATSLNVNHSPTKLARSAHVNYVNDIYCIFGFPSLLSRNTTFSRCYSWLSKCSLGLYRKIASLGRVYLFAIYWINSPILTKKFLSDQHTAWRKKISFNCWWKHWFVSLYSHQ